MVIYDIVDNKRRRRINKLLEGFGVRIQYSSFECILDIYEYDRLIKSLGKLVNSLDVLRVYRFTDLVKIVNFGEYHEQDDSEYSII